MSRLAVLSNPRSGGNSAGLDAVRAVARRAGLMHRETEDLKALEAALREFAEAGVTVLAINGGDGTVDATLTAMRRVRIFAQEPTLAVLRGGTTNMVAGDVGCGGTPEAALTKLVAAFHDVPPRPSVVLRRPMALRRGEEAEPLYGFFFGTAAIPRMIRLTRRRLQSRGLTGPAGEALALSWALLRLLRGHVASDPVLRPDPVTYRLDDGAWREASAVLFLATSLERLILGLSPAPPGGALGVSGLLHPYRGLLRVLPGFMRGRPAGNPAVLQAQAARLTLRTPASYTLDGELFDGKAEMPLGLSTALPVRFMMV